MKAMKYCLVAVATMLLMSCDSRPELQIVSRPGDPEPPSAKSFHELPSWAEVERALAWIEGGRENSRFEMFDSEVGQVRWRDDDYGARWVYVPATRVEDSIPNEIFPELRIAYYDAAKWRYINGAWEFHKDIVVADSTMRFSGIPDPDENQVIALLRQGGLNYSVHEVAGIPRKIRFTAAPRFKRDKWGFAPHFLIVEYVAETEFFRGRRLQVADATFRAKVFVDPNWTPTWSVDEHVELISLEEKYESTLTREEEARRRDIMERFWRG